MVNEKERIIKKLGITCTIQYPDSTTKESKFLVKRASTIFNSMLSLESHRKGDFIYTDNVTGGCVVKNNLSGETLLTVAMYPETFKDIMLAMVSHMLVINGSVTLNKEVKEADDYGNITTKPNNVVTDAPMYIEEVKHQLKQYELGLHPDVEYLIYAATFEVTELDKLQVVVEGSRKLNLKVLFRDYATYPGIVIIQACTDTRK